MGKPDIWARMETGQRGLNVRRRRTRPRERGLPSSRVRDRPPAAQNHVAQRLPQGAALAGSRLAWTANEHGARRELESSVKSGQPR